MVQVCGFQELTIEQVKVQIKNGTSPQKLLISIMRMPTTYLSVTGKYEPIKERVAKQSKMVKFCLTNGAKLKDAFKEVGDIPVNFIENNLPLIIASKYDPTEVLKSILAQSYRLKNPLGLIRKLIDNYDADAHKLPLIYPNLDSGSIKFLLNKGVKVEALLIGAFLSNDIGKQKELFDLAFKHGANSSSFKDLHTSVENCHEDIFEILIKKYKVPAQDLLNVLMHARIDQHNQTTKKSEPSQELIAKQTECTKLLIANGAKLKDCTNFSRDFVKNNPLMFKKNKEGAEALAVSGKSAEDLVTKMFTDAGSSYVGQDKPIDEVPISGGS